MMSKMLYWTGHLAVNSYARTMLDLDMRYHAPLPAGAKIIAPNHPTTIDPFVSTILLNEQVHILISETLFKIPAFGSYLRGAGHVTVVVKNGRTAFDTALSLLRDGKTIVIFPEGGLSPRAGGLKPLHTGVARLALLTGVPVIPIGIGLVNEHLRYIHTTVDHQPETAYWYFSGPYAVTVGAPVYVEGDAENHETVHRITTQLGAMITDLTHESNQRIHKHQLASIQRKAVMRKQVRTVMSGLKTAGIQSGNSIKTAAFRTSKRWLADIQGVNYAKFVPVLHPDRLNWPVSRRHFRAILQIRLNVPALVPSKLRLIRTQGA